MQSNVPANAEVKFLRHGIPVVRLHGGRPILQPNGQWWEDGVTFNPAAVYLDRSPANEPIVAKLLDGSGVDATDERIRDGVVAVHYRARSNHDPRCAWNRSFIGLAVFTPTLDLLRRFERPVMEPNPDPASSDHLGVEDPRITRVGDTFYMVYCAVTKVSDPDAPNGFGVGGSLAMARSHDLVHWERMGNPPGDLKVTNNKDGALFPDAFGGYFWLLHRPTDEDKAIHLARSCSVFGPWEECGLVLRAAPNPDVLKCWVGAGSVPIPLGDGRYLVIYHTGNWLNETDRRYDIDAAIFDLNRWSPRNPTAIVERRIDRVMTPETPHELYGPAADSVGNVLFPCGSYEYRGDIYIVYGAADTYVLAAKVNRQALLDALEAAPAQRAVSVSIRTNLRSVVREATAAELNPS
jgi:beta-1,2-mannobiose phosphorylase / 1,2-beta-oligomannan phosphorylase